MRVSVLMPLAADVLSLTTSCVRNDVRVSLLNVNKFCSEP